MRWTCRAAVERRTSTVDNSTHFVDKRSVLDVTGIGEVLQLLFVVETILVIGRVKLDLF
jgi:hypothetical protein